MPILDSDIRHYRAQHHPADDASQVGGPRSSLVITGAASGEVIPDGSVVVGDTDEVVYYKTFVRNEHSSLTLLQPCLWLANALPDALPGVGHVKLAASAQDAGKVVRLLGVSDGLLKTEQLTLVDGTVTSSLQYSALVRAEINGQSAAQDVQIRYAPSDALVGVIPAGSRSATAEVDIAVAPGPDDSQTSPNRRTPPSGLTFSRPSSPADCLQISDLGPGVAWGVWRRYRFRGTSPPPFLPGLYVELRISGKSA